MPNHVLYLSYDGISDPLGQSQILPYLKGLALKGNVIHLVTTEKKIDKETAIQFKNNLSQIGINWQYIDYTKRPPIVSTLYDIWKLKRKVNNILKANDIKLIHCRGYITGLVGLSYKLTKSIPFIFDMRGLFADERKDSGNWNIKNPIYNKVYKWFKKKEIKLFKNADYIISLTEKGKQIIETEIVKSSCLKIEIIPCCVDLNKFDYQKQEGSLKNKIKKELNIPEDAFVFAYLGSVGTWYMLDEMIEFFKLLSERITNSIFLFISNEQPAIIENAVLKKGADINRFRMTSQPSSMVPQYLTVSDWGLFFILPVFSKKASSPTKLAEFLAMGIPVITNSGVGDVDELVNENNAGILVDGFTDKAFNVAIQKIIAFERSEKSFYRAISEKYFDVEKGIEKYSEVYKKIIKN